MEFKQSGAYLHDSELLLQMSWYDYRTGQDHKVLSAQVPNAIAVIAWCRTKQPPCPRATCNSVFHSYAISGSGGNQVIVGSRPLTLCPTTSFRQKLNGCG